MIRFKSLFFILLSSCILFIGCTEDNLSHTDEKKAEAFLQVHVPRTDIKIRTIGSPGTPGTQEENAISDVTIYLTNSNKIVKIDNISMFSTSYNTYISDLIPIGKDLLDQEFQLFLVANPQKADFVLRSTSDFKEVYSTQTNTYKLLTPGQMVMSNQVEQSPTPTVTITNENTKDNPASANILLDRLATKIEPQVSVNFNANFADNSKEKVFFDEFTFTVEAAGLLNAATEFNLEQLWGDANGKIQLLSPTWYYKPEAQYFSRFYNTINDYINTPLPPFISFNEESIEGYRLITSPFYCLENNSPFYDYTGSSIAPENQIKTKYKGLTTGVIFKVQAIKNNTAANFYVYESEYYSDTEPDRSALMTAASLSPEDFENISTLRSRGIKVYEDGYIYYTYWIKDQNPAYTGDNYDLSYAIIRNSYYILQVNGLTQIGDESPGDEYEPGEPIDKAELIEIIAICQDWTLVNVAHDFN